MSMPLPWPRSRSCQAEAAAPEHTCTSNRQHRPQPIPKTCAGALHLHAFLMRLASMSTPSMLRGASCAAMDSVMAPELHPMSRQRRPWNQARLKTCSHTKDGANHRCWDIGLQQLLATSWHYLPS